VAGRGVPYPPPPCHPRPPTPPTAAPTDGGRVPGSLWPDCVAGLGPLTCGRVRVGRGRPPRCVSSRPRRSGLGGRRRGAGGQTADLRSTPSVARSTRFWGWAPRARATGSVVVFQGPPHTSSPLFVSVCQGGNHAVFPPPNPVLPRQRRCRPVSPAADAAPTQRGATQWPRPPAASLLTPRPRHPSATVGPSARQSGLTGRPLPGAPLDTVEWDAPASRRRDGGGGTNPTRVAQVHQMTLPPSVQRTRAASSGTTRRGRTVAGAPPARAGGSGRPSPVDAASGGRGAHRRPCCKAVSGGRANVQRRGGHGMAAPRAGLDPQPSSDSGREPLRATPGGGARVELPRATCCYCQALPSSI